MIPKLGLLSLGLLLIALLNAQLMQAQPEHRLHGDQSHNGDGWGYSQPQSRPYGQHEHRHHHGHGHGHGHNHNQYYDRYPASYPGAAQFEPGQGPSFGRGSYGGGQPRGGYAGQPGAGFGNPRPGVDYAAQPGGGSGPGPDYGYQQPEAGYGREGQRVDSGYGGQSGAGFGAQPRPGYGGNNRHFQPRPGQPQEPNQPEYESEQRGQPIQPRPQTGDQGTLDFNYQQPGNAGSPLQPRPQQGAHDKPEFNYRQPGSPGNPLQPRPEVTEPDNGQSSKPIQPRPIDSINVQPSHDAANFNPIQPLPGQGQQPQPTHRSNAGDQHPGDQSVGTTLQPRPGSGGALSDAETNPQSTVDDNIASIFNTNNFMTPSLTEDKGLHGSRNPKSQAEVNQPESIAGRNLFETMPQCPEGTELRGGRCRQKA
ncbi:pro-resilin isoform X1 [Drosophila novamexicana]|uniref:pro-resilin isoform X1 n=1 Tax=Drosophila novamexicana TaxID=47314 RepID=UPI0011E5A7BF|nr:pro-resilin isoform X1 [Drosophila novamexicana]